MADRKTLTSGSLGLYSSSLGSELQEADPGTHLDPTTRAHTHTPTYTIKANTKTQIVNSMVATLRYLKANYTKCLIVTGT